MKNYKFKTYNINEEIDKFFPEDLPTDNKKPELQVVTGGVGVGKTHYIKTNFKAGYLVLDGSEIFRNLAPADNDNVTDNLELINTIGPFIAKKALIERVDIVTEVIGHNFVLMTQLIDSMTDLGYNVAVKHLSHDVSDAYNRHVEKVISDKYYLSSMFTGDFNAKWLIDACAWLKRSVGYIRN
jgi:hypothetical protein